MVLFGRGSALQGGFFLLGRSIFQDATALNIRENPEELAIGAELFICQRHR